ncbi:MAG: 4-hydroxythreonine-4-phosphate dehydrogenase PdxA [Pseudomonadota bacterium]
MPSSNTNSAPLVITLGDPAGIGPEIVAKAWATLREDGPVFFWLGDAKLVPDIPTQTISVPSEAAQFFQDALPILPLDTTQPAKAAVEALERSASLCLSGDASGVVTAPVSKENLYAEGFDAPGQTEFYADACDIARSQTVMMLACAQLRVVPLTIHLPLKDVSNALSEALILNRAKVTDAALRRDFGIAAPRLAFTGLNPHAGENGTIGEEETQIIAPAIAALQADSIDAQGPFAADSLFHAEARAGYDVALTMYHDQALIPIKTLDFHGGVNVTLGLPIVRTSPDHGTAFDIAGKGIANPASMINAITLAAEIADRRARG